MTIANLIQPFILFFDWMRTFTFSIGEVSLTFMDLFVWTLLAGIVIGFINKIME